MRRSLRPVAATIAATTAPCIRPIICVLHCHHYDVIRSRDVISRLSVDDFLCVPNINQTCISLSFHDVITDVMKTESTIRVDSNRHTALASGDQYVKRSCNSVSDKKI